MKKRMTTRRRKALRWCAAAMALLAAAWVLLPRNLTLEMVHERAMEDLLAAPAETLYRNVTPFGDWLVLAQSRDTVCLGVYQKAGWLNWRCKCVLAVDREEGRPFAAGHYYEREYGSGFERENGEPTSRYDYFYGCVWDPAVTKLEIDLQMLDREDQWYGQTFSLDVADLETDGRGERWFFVPQGQMSPEIAGWCSSVTAYDSQGNVLVKRLMENKIWEEP